MQKKKIKLNAWQSERKKNRKRPYLFEQSIKTQLQFASEHNGKDAFNIVLYTDQQMNQRLLFGHSNSRYFPLFCSWSKTAFWEQTLKASVKHGGHVTVWLCFASSEIEQFTVIRLTINSLSHQIVFGDNVRPAITMLKLIQRKTFKIIKMMILNTVANPPRDYFKKERKKKVQIWYPMSWKPAVEAGKPINIL